MPMQAWSQHSPQAVVIDDSAYHFGASLKDLGTSTFFFSKEDFTLDEVLKKSEEKRQLQEFLATEPSRNT